MKNKKNGIYMTFACFLVMALILAPMISLNGLFIAPISIDMAVSRSAVSSISSMAAIFSIIGAFAAGPIFRRWPIRRVMIFSVILSAVSFLGRAFSGNLFYFASFAVLGAMGSVLVSNIPIGMLMNNWFQDGSKGKYTAAAMTGLSFGAIVLNVMITKVNGYWGWRYSHIIISLLILAIALPAVLLFVYDTPAPEKQLAENAKNKAQGISKEDAKPAFKLKSSWPLILLFIIIGLPPTLYTSNIVIYYTDLGVSAATAARFLIVTTAASFPGKLIIGSMLDRLGETATVIYGALCLGLCWLIILLLPQEYFYMTGAAILMGLGNGAANIVTPVIVKKYFGPKRFSSMLGIATALSAIGVAVGFLLGSVLYDCTGSYKGAWVAGFFCTVVMIGLISMIKQKGPLYKQSAECTMKEVS